MSSTRRQFLTSSVAISAASLLACRRSQAVADAVAVDDAPPAAKLRILILGGTKFVGPPLVEAAIARGHDVTIFNRGQTNPHLFPDLLKLRGDRDPNKGEGLKALEGLKFDVVYDDCGFFPRMVKASAELLAPNIGQYVFVSSISAYKDTSKEDLDETAALGTMADPTIEAFGDGSVYYGPLKALCEQAAEAACPGRATIVRPGYIVGPGDGSDRFTWWPLRVERGGEMLVPGNAADPIQIIDVRDLAAWMVKLGEKKTVGAFNAVGPDKRLTMGEVLDASSKIAKSDAKFTYVTPEFLRGEGLNLDETFPIWSPYEGETKGFHTLKNARAIESGLRFTPVADTIRATLDWFHTLPAERQAAQRAGVPPELEKKLLEKWHARK